MEEYKEKEKKILAVDPIFFEENMKKIGAVKVYDGIRDIITFDTPDFQLRAKGKDIRITEEEKIKLSCDIRKKIGSGNEYGIKVFVSRTKEMIAILAELDLVPVAKCSTPRVSYKWEGVDFDLDTFAEIDPFLEIDLGESNKSLNEVLDLIELTKHQIVEMSTQEVYKYYGKDYFEVFKIK